MTKCSLKTLEALSYADGHAVTHVLHLSKCSSSKLLQFFYRKVLSDVLSEIHLVDVISFLPDNLSGLKKIICKFFQRKKFINNKTPLSKSHIIKVENNIRGLRSIGVNIWKLVIIWDRVFQNGLNKICGKQPLKNFTWSILKYFAPHREWLFGWYQNF